MEIGKHISFMKYTISLNNIGSDSIHESMFSSVCKLIDVRLQNHVSINLWLYLNNRGL